MGLSSLASLHLVYSSYTADGMAALTAITSLRCLQLRSTERLPACLSALTRLEQLGVHSELEPLGEELCDALPRLQNLTCLSLDSMGYLRIPPALAELPRLQRLCADVFSFPGDASLPRGAWLASIRWLGLPWGVWQAATGVLTHAPRLEYLCAIGEEEPPAVPAGHSMWTFAAFLPALPGL